jgi:hypothetical protein
MTKVAERLNAALGVSRTAKSAKTAQELEHVVDRLRSDLIGKTALLADLQNERESILLDGGSEESLYARISRTQEEIETLRLNFAEAERRRDLARSTEYKQSLENAVARIRETEVPALQQAYADYYAGLNSITDAGQRISTHQGTIVASDADAKAHGRPDLVIDAVAIRQAVAAQIAPVAEESPPNRYGRGGDPVIEEGRRLFRSLNGADKVKYAVWTQKNPGVNFAEHETDAAYALRLQSWQSRQEAAAQHQDPFATAASAAREIIDDIADRGGAFERSRNGVLVNRETFVRNGEAHIKIRVLDGKGKVGDGPLSPMTPATTSPAEYHQGYEPPSLPPEREPGTHLNGWSGSR